MQAPVRSAFATADPDEGVAMLAEAYGDNQLRVSGNVEHFQMAQSRVDLGEVRLDEYANTLITEYTFEPMPSTVNVVRVLKGTVEYQTSHATWMGGPGDVLLTPRPGEAFQSKVDGARLQVIGLDLSLLDQVDTGAARTARRLRTEPLQPAPARLWQRSVNHLSDVLTDDVAAASPLILGAAGRLLAAALLTTFDPAHESGATGSQARDRNDATPGTVRRAIAYVETSSDLDIGVADIARASHVGVRALQLAFRRHLDTTPLGYLRQVRLDRARADLLDADPCTGATVTRIAARWGFTNPSRFSADYQAAFGELPRQTLHA